MGAQKRVIIIGAGPGGICTAIQLQKSGRNDFVILEKAPSPGGTWYHNRYLGCACDVPSHLYSFSFEPKMDWPRPYSEQPIILDYMKHCVEKYGLDKQLHLNSGVKSASWDDNNNLWKVTTESGEVFEGEIMVGAVGMFNDLVWPDIEGMRDFEGVSFHTADWNDDYDLTGKRVAVIGSAASAVQLLPPLAELAAQVDMYQRTANWVNFKEDTPYTEAEIQAFIDNPETAAELRRSYYERVDEGLLFDDPERVRLAEEAGSRNRATVENPELREKLMPTHSFGCKRPLLSNEFYPAFNRDNVELITDGIEKIVANGVIDKHGTLREVDTIIYATGFQTTKFLSSIDVRGRGGRRLEDDWADGAQAYLGSTVPGYPNMFMLYGPNTNNGSIIEMIESQVSYAMKQIERIEKESLDSLEVKSEVYATYNNKLQEAINNVDAWGDNCLGYYRAESGRVVTQWPNNMAAYSDQTSADSPDSYIAN